MATIQKAGFKVRVPKGQKSLGDRANAALNRLMAEKRGRLSSADGCAIVFFRGKEGLVAAQRCEGRKLRAHNIKQCRKGGKGPTRFRYARCR